MSNPRLQNILTVAVETDDNVSTTRSLQALLTPLRFLLMMLTALAAGGLLLPHARADEARAPFTYVAIGASDGVGVGARDPEAEGWVPRLGVSLGPQTRVVNLGVSGSTLEQALSEQLGPALDVHADLVTVWLAVNDLNARVPLETYRAELDQLLSALQPMKTCVLVGNVPDLPRTPAYSSVDPDQLRAVIRQWNAVIASVSADHGAKVVDLAARWQEISDHPEYISADGFHPSSDGYAVLAQIFEDTYHRAC
jgi:acyl-CoA thioesterase-1